MSLFKNKYRVESTRLPTRSYGDCGLYFVTICAFERENYFGTVRNGGVFLSEIGKAASECWMQIPEHFPFVSLEEFVVMPNHIHGIIVIDKPKNVETQDFASLHQVEKIMGNKFGPQSKNLGSIIRGFKIGVTKYARNNNLVFEWQPRFHDHIIRDEESHLRIRNYIINNPSNWQTDVHFKPPTRH